MNADAIVDLNAERVPGFIRTEHRVSGTAVRAVDEEGRFELKSRWFVSQLARIRWPMLLMALLFGRGVDYLRVDTGDATLQAAGEAQNWWLATRLDPSINVVFWIAIGSLTVAMFVSRWPQLVRPTAICFLAKAVQNGLAVLTSVASLVFLVLALLSEPRTAAFDDEIIDSRILSSVLVSSRLIRGIWALSFFLFYLYLGRRAWRIDEEFRTMAAASLPRAAIPRARQLLGRFAWLLAVALSVAIIGSQTAKIALIVVDGVGRMKRGTAPDAEIVKFAQTMNDAAWHTVTDPNLDNRSVPMATAAVMQAEQAVSRRPDNAVYRRTLGAAHYRARDFSGAIRDLERSVKLGGFDARAAFLLAAVRAKTETWKRPRHSTTKPRNGGARINRTTAS